MPCEHALLPIPIDDYHNNEHWKKGMSLSIYWRAYSESEPTLVRYNAAM
jgi:hypothetical protein